MVRFSTAVRAVLTWAGFARRKLIPQGHLSQKLKSAKAVGN